MGKKVKKGVKSLGKSVSKPFSSLGKEINRGVSSAFKEVERVGQKVEKEVKNLGREVDSTVRNKLGGWDNVATGGLAGVGRGIDDALNPDFPTPDVKDPAPPAPTPEQYAEDLSRPENVGRRKRNRRAGLRIDLNTGGAPSGSGVNLPVG